MIFMHHNDEDAWWNNTPYELECKGEIECYDKINELHPKYPVIIYNHARRYKQRLKKIVSFFYFFKVYLLFDFVLLILFFCIIRDV